MIAIINRIGIFLIAGLCFSFIVFVNGIHAEENIPIGKTYKGPKCVISVGDFTVRIQDAPQEIGDGLREMLQTALFESNYFIVVDRLDTAGISAEQLLSDSFLSNPDEILKQGQMYPAEVMVYGAVVSLEGGGLGLRVKVPAAPARLGGAYHKAKVTIDIRVVDSATGCLIAAKDVEGTALSGRAMVGATVGSMDLPMSLQMFKKTPLELAIRDCIYRAVISLCKTIPKTLFKHRTHSNNSIEKGRVLSKF